MSSTAAKVGVGIVGLGTKVANAVNAVVAPVVAKMLRTLRDRALSNKDIQQAVEDMSEAAGVDDDDVRGWVESIIGLCASALGIYVAHRLDDVVFLYGACGAGAALAVDKCAELGFSFKPRARHLVVGALAGAGFAYQTTGIGPGLPFFIRWPLLPFRASEARLVVPGLRHPRRRRAGAGGAGGRGARVVWCAFAVHSGPFTVQPSGPRNPPRRKPATKQKKHHSPEELTLPGQPKRWSNRQHDEAMALRRRRGHR